VGFHYNRSYTWWLHKAYASMGGEYVLLDEKGENFDGLLSTDEEEKRILALVGSYTRVDTVLTVRLKNLDSVVWLGNEEIIQVTCSRYPREPFGAQDFGIADTSDVGGAVPFKEFRLLTPLPDSLDIEFSGSEVIGNGEAVAIEIRPAVPDTVSVSQ